MDVSPQTIREVEFREKLKGYHQDDVDDFLERIAAGLEILQERLRQATERAVRAEQKVGESTEADDAMRRTLVLAQRTADAAVNEARDHAQQIVASAQSQAQQIVAAAEEQAARMAEESQRDLWADIGRLEVARDQLRSDIASLDGYLDAERARLQQALMEMLRRFDAEMPSLAATPQQHEIDLGGIRRWDTSRPEPSTAPVGADAAPAQ
ncbi:MAG: cell division initiation protein [Acidimicrobiaceae bacterium]|jgi:cell division initiation protein|nr:cell division initiation protein [Acidimicrobiaceae bacterium]MDQ1446112.1 cell division initiation protein [Acidimicrobiaceae bacterium]